MGSDHTFTLFFGSKEPLCKTMILYKYYDSKIEKFIFNDETLRIGTLYDFQFEEKYGDEIGDKKEGIKDIYATHEILDSKTKLGELSKNIQIPNNAFINLPIDSKITLTKKSCDLFLLCLSEEYNKSQMKKMGYDACFIIKNCYEFFRLLIHSMNHLGVFRGYGKCIYMGRNFHYSNPDSNIHPALIKETKYAAQKEVRMIWESHDKNKILPQIIHINGLKKIIQKYCE